jgi:hypothetical protein
MCFIISFIALKRSNKRGSWQQSKEEKWRCLSFVCSEGMGPVAKSQGLWEDEKKR